MAASKVTSKVSPNFMRGLILILAAEQGFKHSQTSTYVDVFTKAGASPIVATWGHGTNGHLLAFSQGNVLVEGKASMLQRLQTKLGKAIALDKKWSGVTPAKKAEAVEFMTKHTKEVAPA